jgi:very-short-patch-repair endonuclease
MNKYELSEEIVKEIIELYKNGNSLNKLRNEFKIGHKKLKDCLPKDIIRTTEEVKRITIRPKKLSKKHKEKISDSLKKCHKEKRHNGWSFINSDKNRESYPEKFFKKYLNNLGLMEKYKVEEKLSFSKYFLDFAFVDLKLDVEIDGSQHYRDAKSIIHDIKRNKFLNKCGWKVYRIKWKNLFNNTEIELKKFEDYLNNYENNYNVYYDCFYDGKKCACGNEIVRKANMCSICSGLKKRKVERPPLQIILKNILKLGYVGTGKKYGVSDNAIRKWVK